MAAGYAKDARLVDELASFGFGHVEISTVMPRVQPGNPAPYLFCHLREGPPAKASGIKS
ncbi:hypothetical protein LGH70_09015 [Hymenobacter sp. BT635]|uniref:Uncharacterized protein n=1 Tax=Hymenobacter nitidus TaxID=2880929 RepID=A0ABS8AE71_9BACT|nr:hypothetical protein [Hymenobacter nitidus]